MQNVLQSSLAALAEANSSKLRTNLKIKYVDSSDAVIGIDQGGVLRDWLHRMTDLLFKNEAGLVSYGIVVAACC